MSAETTQELTLHLSQSMIALIDKAVKERHATADQIVAESLWFSLHPMRQDALQRLKDQIRLQQSQSDLQLRDHLNPQLSEQEEERLAQLLESNREDGLTEEEQTEIQRLFDRIEASATAKAAAIWLLSGKSSEPDTIR